MRALSYNFYKTKAWILLDGLRSHSRTHSMLTVVAILRVKFIESIHDAGGRESWKS